MLRHLRRAAAALPRRRASGRRAGRRAAWPASGSPPAPGWCSSARSTRDSDAAVVTVSGSSAALPGTEPGSVKVTPYAEYPAQGPRHRRRPLPPVPARRGRPHAGLGRRGAAAGGRRHRAWPSTCPTPPGGATARAPPPASRSPRSAARCRPAERGRLRPRSPRRGRRPGPAKPSSTYDVKLAPARRPADCEAGRQVVGREVTPATVPGRRQAVAAGLALAAHDPGPRWRSTPRSGASSRTSMEFSSTAAGPTFTPFPRSGRQRCATRQPHRPLQSTSRSPGLSRELPSPGRGSAWRLSSALAPPRARSGAARPASRRARSRRVRYSSASAGRHGSQ